MKGYAQPIGILEVLNRFAIEQTALELGVYDWKAQLIADESAGQDVHNPRYVLYSLAHGVADPRRMLELDRIAWPGGCMVGFMLWIQSQWPLWQRAQELAFPELAGGNAREWEMYRLTHAHVFDEWLRVRVTQCA